MSEPLRDPILDSVEPLERREAVPGLELRIAILCVACEWIYPATDVDCPRCHSAVRFPITRVISRALP